MYFYEGLRMTTSWLILILKDPNRLHPTKIIRPVSRILRSLEKSKAPIEELAEKLLFDHGFVPESMTTKKVLPLEVVAFVAQTIDAELPKRPFRTRATFSSVSQTTQRRMKAANAAFLSKRVRREVLASLS